MIGHTDVIAPPSWLRNGGALPPQSNSLGGLPQRVLHPRPQALLLVLTVSQEESNMRRGDVMVQMQNIKVLFIAGFGPIVPEAAPSRRLYSQMLGINFQEETGGYLHTEALKGANSFALWPLSQAAQSCLGQDSWPQGNLRSPNLARV